MPGTLLVELGCEELPAPACRVADREAASVLARLLEERRLGASGVEALVSPRRIAVLAHDVPERQAARRVEHRGPPERVARDGDGWTRAAEGFARRHGRGADALELRDGFAWISVEAETAALEDVVGDLVDGLVDGLQMPKNMRWGTETLRFARPIRTLAVLHAGRVLPVELAGVRSSRTLRGHRLVAPELELETADRYVAALGQAGVVVPTAARRAAIESALDEAAQALDATWSDPGDVLDEVVYLVERPHVVAGRFADEHLALPDRVLVTAMQSHQRYLPLDRGGRRFPGFLTVVNSDPAHDDTVRAGNERVLEGRLEDAAFSFEQDLGRGLEAMAASLDRVTFHARAGTLADKTARLVELVAELAGAAGVDEAERDTALEAARLAKADQASTMVAEFAELEGYIGGRYALRAGLPEPVASAIAEQFLPDRADAAPPETAPGALLALADKLDTLSAMLVVGEQPTGSRDPYALRRAAAGIVTIVVARGWHVDLRRVVALVHALLVRGGARVALDEAAAVAAVSSFVLDRVDALLEGEQVPFDLVRVARGAKSLDPLAHAELARALAGAATGETFDRVHTAYTRCHRLAARSGADAARALDEAALEDPTERALAQVVSEVAGPLRAAVAGWRYDDALHQAARLGPPVDAFFDAVLVMHEDPRVRANRLRLLVDVTDLCGALGDFSEAQR